MVSARPRSRERMTPNRGRYAVHGIEAGIVGVVEPVGGGAQIGHGQAVLTRVLGGH
jgi:hypothetical protein